MHAHFKCGRGTCSQANIGKPVKFSHQPSTCNNICTNPIKNRVLQKYQSFYLILHSSSEEKLIKFAMMNSFIHSGQERLTSFDSECQDV